jgi:hypothetical protein
MFTKLLCVLLARLQKTGTVPEPKNGVFFELSGLLGLIAILRDVGIPKKTVCDVLEPFPSRRENITTYSKANVKDTAMRKHLGKNSSRKPP